MKTGVPVSQHFYDTMRNKIDRQAEFSYDESGYRYSASGSVKENLKQAVEDLKDLNPVAAFKKYALSSEEMRGAMTLFAPIWLPIVMVSAPLRAVKDAVVDNLIHAGVATYHRLAGKNAVSAGADAVE